MRGLKATFDGRPWVEPAAGDEEGDKEVVQLRYLQKSNLEQLDKLYVLIRAEPLTIHHYLQVRSHTTALSSQLPLNHLRLSIHIVRVCECACQCACVR